MRVVIAAALLYLFSVATASATGVVETQDLSMKQAVGREITLRGVISVYGSEPVTYLGLLATGEPSQDGLSTSDVQLLIPHETVFALEGDLVAELRKWQGSRVELTGTLVREPVGPGMPALLDVQSFSLPQR